AGREDLRDAATTTGAEDELGGVDAAGEVEQRFRDIRTDDLVVGAAQALDEDPLAGQVRRAGAGQAVVAGHVYGEPGGALGAGGRPGGPADEGVAFRAAGQGHHDPLAGLPGRADVVLGAVPAELFVDLVGQPQQRQLAQRGEVADPEVVAERGVDLLRL